MDLSAAGESVMEIAKKGLRARGHRRPRVSMLVVYRNEVDVDTMPDV